MKFVHWSTPVLLLCLTFPATAQDADVKKRVEGNNAFALDLYKQLKQRDGNLFISPYSISTALGMTYMGARGNTATQMAEVLHFDQPQDELHAAFKKLIEQQNGGRDQPPLDARSGIANLIGRVGDGSSAADRVTGARAGLAAEVADGDPEPVERAYQLSVANALWGEQTFEFLPEFLSRTESSYGAGLRPVDFRSDSNGVREEINSWVEGQTHDKIKELLPPGAVDSSTQLVLTNAIYFKGDWARKFDPNDTDEDAKFTKANGSQIDAPLMFQEGKFKHALVNGAQVVELPYRGDDLSMLVILPDAADGLPALEDTLSPAALRDWTMYLQEKKVKLHLPRFKLTSEFKLKDEALAPMGMTDAFSGAADFSGMTGRRDLKISEVIHKAFVEVNEEGTEAAAATAVVATRGISFPAVFKADHPFMFLIRDNRSGSILFMGRVTQ